MAEEANNTAVAQPQENKNSYDELVAKLAKKLEENGQLILTGAPGTGKTYTAQQIAANMLKVSIDELKDSPNYKLVQFHPGYSYSDFVEGLKPEKTDGNVTFKLRDGVFKEFCKEAELETKNGLQPQSGCQDSSPTLNLDFESIYKELYEIIDANCICITVNNEKRRLAIYQYLSEQQESDGFRNVFVKEGVNEDRLY